MFEPDWQGKPLATNHGLSHDCVAHGLAFFISASARITTQPREGSWVACRHEDRCIGTFKWKAGDGRITTIDYQGNFSRHMCNKLWGRNMLLIGDSVSRQSFIALGQLLRMSGLDGPMQHAEAYRRLWPRSFSTVMRVVRDAFEVRAVCNSSATLVLVRNDWLDGHHSYPAASAHNKSDRSFLCATSWEQLDMRSRAILRNFTSWEQLDMRSRAILRNFTHLCGAPARQSARSQLLHMKESAGWSQLVIRSSEACGRDDSRPCDGCAALGDVRSLCETVLADTHTRRDFCAQVGTAAAQQHALQPKSRSLYTDLIEPFGDPALCTPWADRTFLSPFQVVLVNSGAHQVPVARYNEAMCQAARVLQAHARATEAIVAFRTTIPTFDNCHLRGKASPFASLAEAEMYIENHTYFNHGLWVKEFNNLAAHHFRRAGLHVLDAYSQSVLRTDDRSSKTSATGVVDCLHFAERPGGPAFGASNPEERDLLRTSLPYWSVQLLDFL